MKRIRLMNAVPFLLIGTLIGTAWYLDTDFWAGPKQSKGIQETRKLLSEVSEARRQESLRRAREQLDEIQQEVRHSLTDHLKDLAEFFAEAKKRTPAFADEVLGWRSKWRLATDHVPYFGTNGAHQRYVAERFAQHLFGNDDVERAIAQMVVALLADIEAKEGAMLVKLRQNLGELPGEWQCDALGKVACERWILEATTHGEQATRRGVRNDVLQILVSTIVTEAILHLANRMSVSAMILGGGAAASEVSFGTSLLVGLAVDQAVGWTWNAIADPKGQLVARLNRGIDELNAALVAGTESSTSLRRHLERMIEERDRLRRVAVLNALGEKGGD